MSPHPIARAPHGSIAATALLLALALGAAPAGAARAPRLDYHGTVLPRATVEALLARARAGVAPGTAADSTALAAGLGAVVARLQELGFLEARAVAEGVAGNDPRLDVTVREGPRRRFRSITLVTASPADSAALAAILGLGAGDWASPAGVRAAIQRVLEGAAASGHPHAALGVSGWASDSGDVALTLAGELGPQVMVTGARVEGLHVTHASIAEHALGDLAGRPFRPADAEAARDRLARLGLFESVRYQGLEPEGDPGRAHLVYRVVEPRYNQFEGAVGMQGQAGAVGAAHVELGNLLGTGRSLGLRWEARGAGLSDLSAHYGEPFVLRTSLALELAVAQQVQDTLWVRTRWGANGRVPVGATQSAEAGYEEERVVQGSGPVEETDFHTTHVAFERGLPDAASGPRRLNQIRIAASQSFKSERLRPEGSQKSQAGSLELGTQWRRPLGAAAGVGLELRAATRFSTQRVLPLFERYPLGGASSLRGYDEEQFRADRYVLARLEWSRWLGASASRVFLFWDRAWLAARLADPAGGDQLQTLQRDGVGCGLRLGTPGGLVGLDYGLEPGRAVLEGKVHLQLVSRF